MNIFNWRLALKEEVAAFIKKQKEDYKDEHLYNLHYRSYLKKILRASLKKHLRKLERVKHQGFMYY